MLNRQKIREITRAAIVWVAVAALCIFCSIWIIVGGPKFSIMLIGLVLGVSLMALPIQQYFFAVFSLNFFVLGPIQYFFGFDTRWLSFALGLTLVLRGFVGPKSDPRANNVANHKFISLPNFYIVYILMSAILSWLVYKNSFQGVINQIRNMLFMWGVYFVFSKKLSLEKSANTVFVVLVASALIQIPMALYQALFIVPNRQDETAWDAVVGTFPGYMDAGGDSGSLALFLIAISAMLVLAKKKNITKYRGYLWLLPIICLPLAFGETKVAIVIIPLWILIIYRSDFLKSPIKGAMVIILSLLASIALSAHYFEKYNPGAAANPDKVWGYMFGFSANTDVIRAGGEVGRLTSVAMWAEAAWSSPIEALTGQGLGATATGDGRLMGGVGRKFFPLHLGNTSLALLLWETGVIGAVTAICLLLMGSRRLIRSANRATGAESVLLETAGIFLFVQIPLLLYNSAFCGSSIPTQILILAALGVAFSSSGSPRQK